MVFLTIEPLSEGYVIESDGKRFAVTKDRIIQKVKALLGITDHKNPSTTPQHSVQPVITAALAMKDRKEEILKVGKLAGLGRKKSSEYEKMMREIDSVPKAPEISAARKDRKEKEPDDWLRIEAFEWGRKKEKPFKTIFFVELDDGRVMLSYSKGRYFTTIENVRKIPFPVPRNYLYFVKSSNHKQAVATYREYLHLQDQKKSGSGSVRVPAPAGSSGIDRKHEEDLDRAFKPMLKGAFSTRTDYDAPKVGEGGSL